MQTERRQLEPPACMPLEMLIDTLGYILVWVNNILGYPLEMLIRLGYRYRSIRVDWHVWHARADINANYKKMLVWHNMLLWSWNFMWMILDVWYFHLLRKKVSKAVNFLWHQSLKLVQNNQSEGSVISDDKINVS